MYLPKREELSFRVVFALPNASRMGLVARICFSISLDSSNENLDFDFEFESGGLTEARYRIMNFAYNGINRPRSPTIDRNTDRFRFSSTTRKG
jgi:hypothetical protein